ncbi:MAG: putative porin [Muribaculaceae bacterium]|nr:putative porin [Muribaculaceae bacterium]
MISMLSLAAAAQGRVPGNLEQAATDNTRPKVIVPTTAWETSEPIGLREPVPVDTMEFNYYRRSIPSTISPAWVCTGNLGTQGKNMVFMEQKPISQFFMEDAMMAWLPFLSNHVFYNSAWPHTTVSYNTGGSRDNSQDRLQAIFTGNFNAKAQFGANMDYLYSKGSYSDQSTKHMNWGVSGSYLGDRYEFQGAWYHYNMLNKENGGITDDLYITDPAKLQGGVSTINPQSIPTRLQDATNRYVGGELFLNNRYKVGYWHEERDSVDTDSVLSRTFVAVSSFFWNLNYKQSRKRFRDANARDNSSFWENSYFSPDNTEDLTKYMSISNSVGISMLEGFHKYAKFGLAAYLTYELRKFTQTDLSVYGTDGNYGGSGCTALPDGFAMIDPRGSQNMMWAGGEISKQHGSILTYLARAEIGLSKDAIGEFKADGDVSTRIPLPIDTLTITGFGRLSNTNAPYLMNNYYSNHLIWKNNFGKERRARFGGRLIVPRTGSTLEVSTETLQNMLYFNDSALPAQHDGAIQVFAASLRQQLHVGILHWDNQVIYQTSTNEDILPLPTLAWQSNLYIKCMIATLSLQLGVDCDYYTRYYAPAYQPATATFHNQHEIKCGNYPFMTAYANMKLGRTRFYVMMTHVNQGVIGGNDYFSSPHYPMNPRRFQMGLSVDFWD